jgi:RNA polymerase sigma-70 factor (ECF subfamily)
MEDVVQEVLISLHRDRHTYDPGRSFVAWLHAIARHRLVDWARRHRRWVSLEDIDSAPEGAAPGPEAFAEQSAWRRLQAAFARLSPLQREAIALLKLEGWSVRQVAESTGRTESAVKVSVHRGHHLLRKLLMSRADDE